MRVGNNPYKDRRVTFHIPEVSLGVVTHYTEDPYHARRLPIVLMCIDSMVAGAHGFDYELIIWDNGSTPDFQAMLQGFNPHVLIESTNVGLDTAKHNIAEIANADILALSDDDILYSPDWLDKHMEILTIYPNVGTVSGSPIRTHFRWGIQSNLRAAQEHGFKVERGKFIPDEWARDYCLSVERDPEEYARATASVDDILFEYHGVKAWAHGHHMQFLGYRKTLAPFLVKSPFLLNDAIKTFDVPMDEAGVLRLTTYARTSRHLGNVLDENVI
jgi:glycosyltransferase involved in cell wall biosynthesis